MLTRKKILVVDDEAINRSILKKIISPMYEVYDCESGEKALHTIKTGNKPDLVLLDIIMPGIDGYETLTYIHNNPETSDIPVIFVSILNDDNDEVKGLELGAVDYLRKPYRPGNILAKIMLHFEQKEARDRLWYENQELKAEIRRRIMESKVVNDAAIIALTQLESTRDNNTGNHILRTCKYIEILSKNLQKKKQYRYALTDEAITSIVRAAALHDIGKIGIPDSVLLKKGDLIGDDVIIMKMHCQIGSNTILNIKNRILNLYGGSEAVENIDILLLLEQAAIIAANHHERWDGSGYPRAVMGKDIPLSARLMALADVFDALTTERPYKRKWGFNETAEYIISQKNLHFDPDVVTAFENELDAFRNILESIENDTYLLPSSTV